MEKYIVKKGDAVKRSKMTEGGDENCARGSQQPSEEGTEESPNKLGHSRLKKAKASFALKEVKGDLFAAPESESLAHCISADVKMGKGIAKIFKQKFGGVDELTSQGVKPGGVAVLRRGPRFIYYMVTKEKYWQKPTYESLKQSLASLAKHCHDNRVTSLSMPRIGCGLDGLQWDKVRDLIKETFRDYDITVTVYTL